MSGHFFALASLISVVLYMLFGLVSMACWFVNVAIAWTNSNKNFYKVVNPFEWFAMTKIYGCKYAYEELDSYYDIDADENLKFHVYRNKSGNAVDTGRIYFHAFLLISILYSIISAWYYFAIPTLVIGLVIAGLYVTRSIKTLIRKINKIETPN